MRVKCECRVVQCLGSMGRGGLHVCEDFMSRLHPFHFFGACTFRVREKKRDLDEREGMGRRLLVELEEEVMRPEGQVISMDTRASNLGERRRKERRKTNLILSKCVREETRHNFFPCFLAR